MSRALPSAQGLQLVNGLRTAKGIEIHFTPSLAIVAGGLRKLNHDIESFRKPLTQSIKEVVIPSIQKNFEVGGRPPWAPLADTTVERKGSDRKLVNTGALQKGMKALNIWTITKNYAVIQDIPQSIWYGKVQQAGLGTIAKTLKVVGTTKANSRNAGSVSSGEGIPARPFVLLQKSDERKIESIFRHWLDERVRINMGRL